MPICVWSNAIERDDVTVLVYGMAVMADGVDCLLRSEGIDDVSVRRLRMHGSAVNLYFTLDVYELARRAAVGAHSIEDNAVLGALLSLPHGVTTPMQFVDPAVWPLLFTAGSGHVAISDEGFTRLAAPPCTIHLIEIRSPDWQTASAALSDLNVAARCVVELAAGEHRVTPEASLFGFGVVQMGQLTMQPEALQAPGHLRSWQLAELLSQKQQLPDPVF